MAGELLPPCGVALLAFTFVLLMDQLPRVLGVLVAGDTSTAGALRLLGTLLPAALALTLPAAFLTGVLLGFARMAGDSEMVGLCAAGVRPARLLVPVLLLAVPMGALTAHLHTTAVPEANRERREILSRLALGAVRSEVRPRTFARNRLPGGMTVYVQDVDARDGSWNRVLLHQPLPGSTRLILADSARLRVDHEQRVVRLELQAGRQHEFSHDPRQYEQLAFGRMDLTLPVEDVLPGFDPARRRLDELTMAELSDTPGAEPPGPRSRAVEWHRRLAAAGACAMLGLLGTALSAGVHRRGRAAAFGLAIVVIFLHHLLARVAEQAGHAGTLPAWLGAWAANLVLLAVSLVVLRLAERGVALALPGPGRLLGWMRRQRERCFPGTRPMRSRAAALGVRFPSILDLYLARAWAAHLALLLAALTSVITLAEIVDLMDDLERHGVGPRTLAAYFGLRLWQIVFSVAPVAVLLTVLVTLGLLARRSELTAMKAGGISLYRVCLPLLALGLVSAVGLHLLQERVLPATNRAAAVHWQVLKGRAARRPDAMANRWLLGRENRFYRVDGVADAAGGRVALLGLSIWDIDTVRWRLLGRTQAERALWDEATGRYRLLAGWQRRLSPPSFATFVAKEVSRVDLDPSGIEPPSHFRLEPRAVETFSFGELLEHTRILERRGFDATRERVELQSRLSFPSSAVVMTLLAVPFSFVVAGRHRLWGAAAAIGMAMAYWGALGLFEALGRGALLSPLLAAWAPHVLFGAAGLYLVLRIET